jgi:histone H3/H4
MSTQPSLLQKPTMQKIQKSEKPKVAKVAKATPTISQTNPKEANPKEANILTNPVPEKKELPQLPKIEIPVIPTNIPPIQTPQKKERELADGTLKRFLKQAGCLRASGDIAQFVRKSVLPSIITGLIKEIDLSKKTIEVSSLNQNWSSVKNPENKVGLILPKNNFMVLFKEILLKNHGMTRVSEPAKVLIQAEVEFRLTEKCKEAIQRTINEKRKTLKESNFVL